MNDINNDDKKESDKPKNTLKSSIYSMAQDFSGDFKTEGMIKGIIKYAKRTIGEGIVEIKKYLDEEMPEFKKDMKELFDGIKRLIKVNNTPQLTEGNKGKSIVNNNEMKIGIVRKESELEEKKSFTEVLQNQIEKDDSKAVKTSSEILEKEDKDIII